MGVIVTTVFRFGLCHGHKGIGSIRWTVYKQTPCDFSTGLLKMSFSHYTKKRTFQTLLIFCIERACFKAKHKKKNCENPSIIPPDI